MKNASDYSSQSVYAGHLRYSVSPAGQYSLFRSVRQRRSVFKNRHIHPFGNGFWELNGKRFGIIGLGAIGRQVAKVATAFGAEVVYYSTSGRNTEQPYLRLELDEFLSTADVVSIHAPLNENTANLMNHDRLNLMKKSAILINVGRGGIVNEADLAKALDEGLIAGAGIDVFTQEPIDPHNPLLHVRTKIVWR